MSYLVLARKWRPRSFDTLVGQEHVVRALTHALTTQRLHHAWLFTGTRGVGKTTLSRILAKSLNCETGITATPCGKCRACTEIDSGRFVDYLELDAASNRGVDEMTQLLEQAVYSPTVGRFKVYMIDEVHMLTGHAFNAMLKTLEEPPAHVKFILATTDPQKIPVTVLSRCLQFNLKQMPPESIVGHLSQVLDAEQMPYETPALRLIGQAARGSMRDALSLTDQAIAFSAGNLTDDAVRSMLGTIDQRHLVRLLDALADGDGAAVLAVADELATRSLSYSSALGDLAVMLSQIAIAQRIATAAVAQDPLGEDLIRLASRLNPDAVQLFYSIAVHSRAELALAPDEYAGFAMACVRMLAFSAEAGGATVPPGTSAIVPAAAKPVAAPAAAAAPAAIAPLVAASTSFAAASRAPEPAPAAAGAPVQAEPVAAAALPAAAAPAAALPADVSASVPAVSIDAAEPTPAVTPVSTTPVSDMLSTSETVPSAAVDTVLPATPGAAESAESGAVSPPADSVSSDESDVPRDAAPAADFAPVLSAMAVPAAESAPAASVATTPTSASPAAPVFVPPWDVTPEPARAVEPAPVARMARAPVAPAAPAQPDAMEAPVNSPRAAMARALAGGPISPRSGNAGAARPTTNQTPAPARQAAPARAPAPAAPPPRQQRSSGPPDLEPPPWLMDDAEPSFAAPPPGTQGRRDVAGEGSSGGTRGPSRAQAGAPNTSRGESTRAPASSQASTPSSYQTRQQAVEPSYSSSSDGDSSDGDPRDADGSGFADDEGEAFASSAASDAAYYASAASAAATGNAADEAPAPAAAPYTGEPGAPIRLDESWPALAARLPVRGIAAQLARQSELLRIDGNQFVLRVSARTLAEGQGAERLRSVLETHFGQPVRVSVEVGATGSDTAHAVEQSVRSARQQAAEAAILADPFVRTLMDNFGGQIVPNSISPVSPELPVKETPK